MYSPYFECHNAELVYPKLILFKKRNTIWKISIEENFSKTLLFSFLNFQKNGLLELQPMYYRTERGDDIQGAKKDIKLEKTQ